MSRDAQGASFGNLRRVCVQEQIRCITMVPQDFRSALVALRKSQSDEVYHLAGQSSVGLSFKQPAETMQNISMGTPNMLEACPMLDSPPRVYYACSSESCGNTHGVAATETTSF